ncbi:VOC family protein [Bradyrhizobium sp.]|jgi:predicted enzyme related to lactoylglutathione lyase|uniref:VOC family protein n=1 Tax=Bradyrhizobium sp. TaxID=376 RepID=UPI002D73BA6D|nr:VOC family protein [Bradyrhizobium sp.]HZR74804.1 VOC family protein [Bradyrhizobium sp.]
MTDFNLVVLYVKDSAASSSFYKDLLDRPIAQSSPKFAMLPLGKDAMLGLWQRDAVEPRIGNETGGTEVVFTAANADAVRATHDAWKARGLKIAQEPTAMNFGHTFVALDPDGHRLRVLAPAA